MREMGIARRRDMVAVVGGEFGGERGGGVSRKGVELGSKLKLIYMKGRREGVGENWKYCVRVYSIVSYMLISMYC